MNPLIVLRVGYMERYDGPDVIKGGGDYIKKNGVGGEVFNFKPSRGRCYGYAMSLNFAGINLRLLDSERVWRVGDELAGVDVVFIARRPGYGQVVIGWYRNATVFHQQYRIRRGAIPGMEEAARYYLCVTDAESAYLLSEDQRTFLVPYAPAGNAGFPGRSNVWYPESNASKPDVDKYIRKLLDYISVAPASPPGPDEDEASNGGGGGGGGTRKPNHAHNAAVETAAEETAWSYYKAAGFEVQDVASEKLGWDFVASKGRKTLHVEVKGVSAAEIYFELTPREYEKLQQYASDYRVCVVCNALTAPTLYELLPERSGSGWRLMSKSPAVHVSLKEKIAAVGVEVAPGLAKS